MDCGNCGEVLGLEHYYLFDANGKRLGQDASGRILNCSYYKGYYYYLKQIKGIAYLWKASKDGAMIEVIKEIDSNYLYNSKIFVNHAGIYLI